MGFKFRYEALLKYRNHIKEKAEINLSRARNKLRQDKDQLATYRDAVKETSRELDSGLKQALSASMLQAYSEHITLLQVRIEAQKVEIYNSEKIVQDRIHDLRKKTVQYKVIEKLKEKDFKKWYQEQNYLEQKEIDEMAVVRFGKDFLQG